jgi:hypothetical protein
VFQKPVGGDPVVSITKQGEMLMTAKGAMATEPLPEVFHIARRNEDEPVTILSSAHDELILTTASGGTQKITPASVRAPVSITGAWEVSFPPGKGAPNKATFDALILWNDHQIEGIKYFSGTATYRKTISLPAPAAGERLYIDLGKVHELATVRMNGQTLGTLWKEPFRLDITNVAREGNNDLEIEVVNLWVNRLIGDERMYPDDAEWAPQSMGDWHGYGLKKFPAWFADWTKGAGQRPSERVAFSTVKLFSAQDPLCPSGLAGPVRIISAMETPIPAE